MRPHPPSGTPVTGIAPLTVDFTDESTGVVTSWSWDFGDSGTSDEQNPTYAFLNEGTYTVSMTATGPSGSYTETKVDYVFVGPTVLATEAQRNGAGINPLIFSTSSMPILGRNWNTNVDASGYPSVTVTVLLLYKDSLPGVNLPFGELLVDVGSERLYMHFGVVHSGVSHHSVPIPNDQSLAGMTASGQVYLWGVPGGQVTNAIDISLGY